MDVDLREVFWDFVWSFVWELERSDSVGYRQVRRCQIESCIDLQNMSLKTPQGAFAKYLGLKSITKAVLLCFGSEYEFK